MEKVKCALCGADSTKTLLQGKDFRYNLNNISFNIVKCTDCNLVYLNTRPLKENMGGFYPEGYYPKENVLQRILKPIFQRNLSKVKTIASHKRAGRLLEIGCGDGDLLLLLKKQGFLTYGVDISRAACSLTEQKIGGNVFNGEVADFNFCANFFDVIAMNHSFEHVGSPTECLKELKRISKESGVLFISVPNIECFQFKLWKEKASLLDIPRHLYLYSPTTLKSMIEKSGFRVVKMSQPFFVFPPLDILPITLMQKLLNSKSFLFMAFPVLIYLSILRIFLCSLMGAPEIEVIAHKIG